MNKNIFIFLNKAHFPKILEWPRRCVHLDTNCWHSPSGHILPNTNICISDCSIKFFLKIIMCWKARQMAKLVHWWLWQSYLIKENSSTLQSIVSWQLDVLEAYLLLHWMLIAVASSLGNWRKIKNCRWDGSLFSMKEALFCWMGCLPRDMNIQMVRCM